MRCAEVAFRLLAVAAMGAARPASAAPVIVLDAGHGGVQSGASAPTGFKEKALALALVQKVKVRLEAEAGASVLLTRAGDSQLTLEERVEVSNRHRPDVFVSIHANSMPTRARQLLNEGIETYFLSAAASGEDARKVAARENGEAVRAGGAAGDALAFILADLQRAETHADSSRLAYAVHGALIAQTGATDRGVQQAPFYVLMGLDAPAVLVEVGFISHPVESRRLELAEYQDTLAKGIVAGVQAFLEQVRARDGLGSPAEARATGR